MFCNNCGMKLTENAAFCVSCGAKTGAGSDVQNVRVPTAAEYSPFVEDSSAFIAETQQQLQNTVTPSRVKNNRQNQRSVPRRNKRNPARLVTLTILAVVVGLIILLIANTSGTDENDESGLETAEAGERTLSSEEDFAMPEEPQPEPEPEGLTLEEIQGREGVYAKRGDRFIPLHSSSQSNEYLIDDFMELPINDQLVFVGNTPRVYRLSLQYYTIQHRSMTLENGLPRGGFRGFTSVNGIDISEGIPTQLRDYFVEWGRGQPTTGFVMYHPVGLPGQEFTFGRWDGTEWIEWVETINEKVVLVDPIESTYEITFDGYFYLDFSRQSGGLYSIVGGGRKFLIEIESSAMQGTQ